MLNSAQIASIKKRLGLTREQEQYWPAVEAALRQMAWKKSDKKGEAKVVDMSTVDVDGLKSAAFPLVMSFNDEQKRELRSLAHFLVSRVLRPDFETGGPEHSRGPGSNAGPFSLAAAGWTPRRDALRWPNPSATAGSARENIRTRRETTMDMSVTINPNGGAQGPEKTEVRRLPRGAKASDLDVWLEKVEALGELKRITAEVDPDLEAATITYLVGGENRPALLFENIKGHPGHKALYNMIGCNLSRFCLMIGEQPVDHPLKAVQSLQQKLGRKMAPEGGAGRRRRSAARTSSRATRSTSACFRRSACGRSTAASISAPATP